MFNAITELVLKQKKENAAKQTAQENSQTVKLNGRKGNKGKSGCCKWSYPARHSLEYSKHIQVTLYNQVVPISLGVYIVPSSENYITQIVILDTISNGAITNMNKLFTHSIFHFSLFNILIIICSSIVKILSLYWLIKCLRKLHETVQFVHYFYYDIMLLIKSRMPEKHSNVAQEPEETCKHGCLLHVGTRNTEVNFYTSMIIVMSYFEVVALVIEGVTAWTI